MHARADKSKAILMEYSHALREFARLFRQANWFINTGFRIAFRARGRKKLAQVKLKYLPLDPFPSGFRFQDSVRKAISGRSLFSHFAFFSTCRFERKRSESEFHYPTGFLIIFITPVGRLKIARRRASSSVAVWGFVSSRKVEDGTGL